MFPVHSDWPVNQTCPLNAQFHTMQGIQHQRYDTNPMVVRKKSYAVISCSQIHSVHILSY